MKIFGVSQSSGTERQLKVERGIDGVVLTLTDHVGSVEMGRIKVNGDALIGAIMEPMKGGSIIDSIAQPQEAAKQLVVEVRRNEVLLQIQGEDGVGSDAAVGSDDLQDALEGVINRT